MRTIHLGFLATMFLLIAGCAAQQAARDERAADSIVTRLKSCVSVNQGGGTTAKCALQMYESINAEISDSNPDKGPVLVMARKLYTIFLKSDRNEYRSNDDRRIAVMAAYDELRVDLQRARALSSMQAAAEAQRQQQLFQQAQRLLSPTPQNMLHCRQAPGTAPGTMVCQ